MQRSSRNQRLPLLFDVQPICLMQKFLIITMWMFYLKSRKIKGKIKCNFGCDVDIIFNLYFNNRGTPYTCRSSYLPAYSARSFFRPRKFRSGGASWRHIHLCGRGRDGWRVQEGGIPCCNRDEEAGRQLSLYISGTAHNSGTPPHSSATSRDQGSRAGNRSPAFPGHASKEWP